jgi:hypothetical protein
LSSLFSLFSIFQHGIRLGFLPLFLCLDLQHTCAPPATYSTSSASCSSPRRESGFCASPPPRSGRAASEIWPVPPRVGLQRAGPPRSAPRRPQEGGAKSAATHPAVAGSNAKPPASSRPTVASSVAASPSSIHLPLHRSVASSPGSDHHHPRSAPVNADLRCHHPPAWTTLQDFDPALASPLGPLLLLLGPSRSAHIAAAAQHIDSGPRRHLIRPTCPASTLIHLCLHNGYSIGRRHRHRCFSRHRRRSGRLGYGPLHPSGRRRLP